MSRWIDIKPKQLRRSLAKHPWLFAYYIESPSDREDQMWYHVLLFRNRDRTVFGAFEHMSESTSVPDFEHQHNFREMASRIIRDADFRNGLLSDDKRFPELWKRR